MNHNRQLRRQEFAHWLRTGRVPAPIEYKFNGWHDPDDGRFTHVGAGRYFPPRSSSGAPRERSATASPPRRNGKVEWQGGGFTGSGGGSFGGGGATGGFWETREEQRAREQRTRRGGTSRPANPADPVARAGPDRTTGHTRHIVRKGDTVSSIASREGMTVEQLVSVNSLSDPNNIQAGEELTLPAKSKLNRGWVSVRVGPLSFEIDPSGRTGLVDGTLGTGKTERSRRMQAEAGRPDRRFWDDGGHFIAPRFGGPKATYNHFAQEANFNRGAYRRIEDSWAKAQKEGADVRVRVDVDYPLGSRRPDRLKVGWIISGKQYYRDFGNERGGAGE